MTEYTGIRCDWCGANSLRPEACFVWGPRNGDLEDVCERCGELVRLEVRGRAPLIAQKTAERDK